MPAYVSEILSHVQGDACFIIRKLDDWTATLQYASIANVPVSPFNPSQLTELTHDQPFFLDRAFVPRRALKNLVGAYQQLVGLKLDHYTVKGWILIGWQTPTEHVAEDLENALFRFADKVIINYLSLQRIALEQQYRFLFSVVPQSIVLVDEANDMGWVNQSAIELLDLPMGDLRPPSATLSEGMMRLRNRALNQDTISQTASQLLQNPDFVIKEWPWIFENQVLSVQTRPIVSPYFRGRIWLFNDVTELYTKSRQLGDAYNEIENLISVIAHDLKSPLATLSFIFNFMPMHGPLNDEQTENIEYGQKTIKRGLNLIDSIVYFNKLISSNQPVLRTDIELDEMLQIVVDGFVAQASQKDITLHVRPLEQPVILHTDPESLVRILDNLLSNALKFSPFGRNVYVEVEHGQQELVICVRDEGPGISPADQAKLFKRFQRLSAQPTNHENSSGLGLSIVKSLCEKIGTTIEVDSTLNVGTTFRLVFPGDYVRIDNQEAIEGDVF